MPDKNKPPVISGRFENGLDLFIGHIRVERKLSGNTVSAYGRDLSAFLVWLEKSGIKEWNKIDRNRLMAYFLDLSAELSPRSRARSLSAIKSFFRSLEDEKVISLNPAHNFESPKLPKTLPKALGPKEIKLLVTAPKTVSRPVLLNRTMFDDT